MRRTLGVVLVRETDNDQYTTDQKVTDRWIHTSPSSILRRILLRRNRDLHVPMILSIQLRQMPDDGRVLSRRQVRPAPGLADAPFPPRRRRCKGRLGRVDARVGDVGPSRGGV